LTVHVLTKIFIVLVSLLAVLLVPLVVVYAQNEETFKAKYDQAVAQKNAAELALKNAMEDHALQQQGDQARIQDLANENSTIAKQLAEKDVTIRRLESELAVAKSMQGEIRKELGILASTSEANQQLTESLVDELRSLRETALASERQIVELDEALRDVTSQLSVAVAARRALEEELQAMRDANAALLEKTGAYIARYGELDSDTVAIGARSGIRPDIDLDATVISVRRAGDGQVLVEIDAGSRDGVKEGWRMTLGRGGTFVGNLQIVAVDINHATGVVTLENEDRGLVRVGDRAFARKGLD
jgi:hypothetical protein